VHRVRSSATAGLALLIAGVISAPSASSVPSHQVEVASSFLPAIDGPAGIAVGPDGALWFTNSQGNSIGRITTSGTVTSYTGTGIDFPQVITTGPDGALWFTNEGNNSIGRITTSGSVANYAPNGFDNPYGITAGPDGALWIAEEECSGFIGRITTNGTVTHYNDSGVVLGDPLEITSGPDGALWFTNIGGDSIGRITTSGQISFYKGTGIDEPVGITTGPDGALWFTNEGNDTTNPGSIGRITTSGQVSNYRGIGIDYPYDITTGPDGALWFTNRLNDSIGRITTSGQVSNYRGVGISWPEGITTGPDGALWFVNARNSSIGRITTLGIVANYTGTVTTTPTPTVIATVINPSNWTNPLSQATLPLHSVTSVPTGTASIPVITVHAQNTAQTIAGFGASLTGEAANLIWNHLSTSPGSSGGVQGCSSSDSVRTCVLDSLFSPTSGAGISLVRISIGGSDFASTKPSSDEQTPGQFTLSADDQDVIQVLKIAKQINPGLQVIATPWTAPTWMKAPGSYVGGSLKSADEKAYAAYFVDFIKEYKANGVTIDYVTPQNEPGDSTNDPSMVMSASNQAAFVDSDLSPALISNGLSTKILVYDWNWDTQSGTCLKASSCWSASGVKSVLKGAPSNVAGIAWHCYSVNNTDDGTATSQSLFQGSLHGSNPLQIMDECSGHGPNYPLAGNLNWDSQNLVITSLNNFGSGVQFWNLALPTYPYTPPSGSCESTSQKDQYCRGVITVTSPTSVNFNVEYYILKALAASIEAGSTHVHTVSSDPGVITSTAAANLDGSTGLYVDNSAAVSSVTIVDGTKEFTYPNALPADSVVSFKWTP
jgi:O-glycosyl hydrolase/streptogramin lyase